ncbi:MAG: hypothetical protein R3E79_04275 [Caldilineaceae bacterium]
MLDPVGDDFSAGAEDLWTTPPTIRQGDTVQLGLNVHRQGQDGAPGAGGLLPPV